MPFGFNHLEKSVEIRSTTVRMSATLLPFIPKKSAKLGGGRQFSGVKKETFTFIVYQLPNKTSSIVEYVPNAKEVELTQEELSTKYNMINEQHSTISVSNPTVVYAEKFLNTLSEYHSGSERAVDTQKRHLMLSALKREQEHFFIQENPQSYQQTKLDAERMFKVGQVHILRTALIEVLTSESDV